jgi:hypothetical protein
MVREQTNFATTHFVASSFPFRREKSAPMDGLRQPPAIRSTIVQSHGYCAPIRQIISHGTGCSALAVRSNYVTKPRKNREHACRWKGSSSAASVSTWTALSTQFAPGIRSTKEAAEKVAVANRKRPSAAKESDLFSISYVRAKESG